MIFAPSYIDYKDIVKQREQIAKNSTVNKPLKIGITYDFADKERYGFIQGVKLAIETINKENRLLNGKKIIFVERDTKSNPKIAMKIAREFALDTDMIAVVSNSPKDVAVSVAVIYEYAGIVYISSSVTDNMYTRDNFNMIFRNIPDDTAMAKALSQLAARLNFKNIVILHSKNEYASTIADVFVDTGVSLGLNINYKISFTDEDKSFEDIIDSISPLKHKELDYDAILAVGDLKNMPILIKQLRENGIYAPIITGDNLNTVRLLDIGSSANNVIVPTYFNLEILNGITQNFISFYKNKYKILPNTFAVQGYDAIMLLAEAINKANTIMPTRISKSLKYINDYISVSGKYSMNTRGNVVGKKVYFNKVVDQKFKFLSIK